MIVTTTVAAKILQISSSRLRILLAANRVEGAYKSGRIWLIPLFNGKPIITKGARGPSPRWSTPRTPAKTIVHVNVKKIKDNQKYQTNDPVITVKKKGENKYCHEVEILGVCRVVYRRDNPFCGARVWIESLYDVKTTNLLSKINS